MFREDHSSLPLTHSHTAMLAELFPSERTWFTDCHPQDDIHCTSEYLPTTTQTSSVGSVNILYCTRCAVGTIINESTSH